MCGGGGGIKDGTSYTHPPSALILACTETRGQRQSGGGNGNSCQLFWGGVVFFCESREYRCVFLVFKEVNSCTVLFPLGKCTGAGCTNSP